MSSTEEHFHRTTSHIHTRKRVISPNSCLQCTQVTSRGQRSSEHCLCDRPVCVYLSSTHEFREGVGGASLGALTQLTERSVEGGLRHTEAQRHHLEQVAVT